MERRRELFIDSQVQFPLMLALLALVAVEGTVVGWALTKLLAAARQWDRPDQAALFFKTLVITLLPLFAANWALGAWLSGKLARPLLALRRGLTEIARGNLEVEVAPRPGDLLGDHLQGLNKTTETLRRLIYRDHAHAAEVVELMGQAQAWLSRHKDLPEPSRKELQAVIDGAKSRLSIINNHFMKGRHAKTEEAP